MGDILLNGFFEMFDTVLSFASNTMSFLRVGGFVLVHAGMMTVVVHAGRDDRAGVFYVLIVAVGNVFVMALEAPVRRHSGAAPGVLRDLQPLFRRERRSLRPAQNLSGPSRGQGRMNLCAHGPHRCRTQLLFCYPARTAPGFVNRFFIALLCKAIKNGPVGRPGPRPKISSVRAQSARMRVKNSSCAIIFYINTTPLCGRMEYLL